MGRSLHASVLVVDDFRAWRWQIRKILQERPEWEIVSEASDGADAVRKATDLHPDVVLLDIKLPTLNGIEVSKIIRQRCPNSRIVFVTLDRDSEITRTAIALGDGYVLKAHAARELVNTIATVLENNAVAAHSG